MYEWVPYSSLQLSYIHYTYVKLYSDILKWKSMQLYSVELEA